MTPTAKAWATVDWGRSSSSETRRLSLAMVVGSSCPMSARESGSMRTAFDAALSMPASQREAGIVSHEWEAANGFRAGH
jgi:hypothetical protein